MKKVLAVLTIFCLIAATAGTILALEPDGNYRKGKYLFRKNCRSCHVEGGGAMVLEPITYTQAEWIEIFKAENWKDYECADEWKKASEQDIKDIFTYMHNYAKDSPTPAKCS